MPSKKYGPLLSKKQTSFNEWNKIHNIRIKFLHLVLLNICYFEVILCANYCVKSVQIWSFSWSIFSCIRTEYGGKLRISSYSVRIMENTDQKKLRIWTLFTQWKVYKLRVYFWFSELRLDIFGGTFFLASTVVEITSFLELQTMGDDRRLRMFNSAEDLRVL